MGTRIVITEEQYKRMFLDEQQLSPLPVDKFEFAQNQWKMYGAENPKTGRNLIPKETIEKLRIAYNNAVEDWKLSNPTKNDAQNKYDLPKVDRGDTESGGISSAMKQSGFVYGDYGYETSKSKIDRETSFKNIAESIPYFEAVNYNKNINDQNKLIPQYCKKPNLTKNKYIFICDNDNLDCNDVDMKRYYTMQKKYNGRFGWYATNVKAGITKYGYYLQITTNPGKDPFTFCANKSSKGVWVYDTEAGPLCGCYNPNNGDFLDELGNVNTEEYVFGWMDKIKKYEASLEPSGFEKIMNYLDDCSSDYHCILDLASIASLAIPGVGLAVSAGLDFLNAATYGVEAANAESSEERNAAIIAGGLTLFGGLLGGGVSQTKRILTKGSQNPKIYKYVDDVMGRVERELPQMKNLPDATKNVEVAKIYKETAEKYGLKNEDILVAHDILKDFSKIDPKIAKVYTDALKSIDSKIGRANLTKLGNNKSFQKIVLENNGDVVTALSKYMKSQAGKEALQELGLFIVLSEVMEIPEVQKWIGEKYNYLKYRNRTDIQGLVEKEGYEWKSTKDTFGSSGSVEDNTLLKKAWSIGWRPYPTGKEPTESELFKSVEWLLKNPKYQTKSFKEKYSSLLYKGSTKRGVEPKDVKDREEGVKYYPNQGWVDYFNEMDSDNIVTDEEQDATEDILDEFM